MWFDAGGVSPASSTARRRMSSATFAGPLTFGRGALARPSASTTTQDVTSSPSASSASTTRSRRKVKASPSAPSRCLRTVAVAMPASSSFAISISVSVAARRELWPRAPRALSLPEWCTMRTCALSSRRMRSTLRTKQPMSAEPFSSPPASARLSVSTTTRATGLDMALLIARASAISASVSASGSSRSTLDGISANGTSSSTSSLLRWRKAATRRRWPCPPSAAM